MPPRLKAKATGSVAFLGDDVLSAQERRADAAPQLSLLRAERRRCGPYLGAGINYTRFTDVNSSLAPDVKMGSSTGLALQAGLNYAITRTVGLFASIAKINVKSKVVAVGRDGADDDGRLPAARLFGRHLVPVLRRAAVPAAPQTSRKGS